MMDTLSIGPTEVVPAEAEAEPKPFQERVESGVGWWDRYRASLSLKMSGQALNVLERDARYIVDKAIPMQQGIVDEGTWPETGLRSGMIVGSVQSGKTASMLGVAALALDRGVDMIILLAGTRVGLWLQTYERLLAQLDGSTRENAFRRRSERLILPLPDDVLNEQRADPTRYLQRPLARHCLRAGKPIIIIVPKEDDHLLKLKVFLLDVLTDRFLNEREKPFKILLLDDEADDASVLDSEGSQKVTPRLIAALWSGDSDLAQSRHPNLLTTYVAYTATPQANYLQATHNPLTPRDFNAALRTPGARGDVILRSLSFTEPKGIGGYYCGGEIFYEHLRGLGIASICQATAFPLQYTGESDADFGGRNENVRRGMLSDALRSFFVSAAIRLHLSEKAKKYDPDTLYADSASAHGASPDPHTMLVHPSARKEDHLLAALDIVRWSMSLPGEEHSVQVPGEDVGQIQLKISITGLVRRLEAEEELWKVWLLNFEATRIALAALPNAPFRAVSMSDWPYIKELLINEVFPAVALRVLNSDPTSDERPRFEPEQLENGFRPAPDLLSIFVAGNVLSRGLTLEGLSTSLFLRGAAEPAADTQMQMQRWFGYRGSHLPFCRLFVFQDQLHLFERYHINDNALKAEIMQRMDGGGESTNTALVLQGANFLATSKIESRKVPLSPGPRPSIRLVEANDQTLARSNLDLVVSALDSKKWVPLRDAKGFQRGLICEKPIGLLELADFLDRLRYSHHDPDPLNELSRRWAHYQSLLGLDESLIRPPGIRPQPYACEPQACPYSIAAYMRLWHSLLEGRHSIGFYPTDRSQVPWSLADASHKRPPYFYLAIRNGELEPRDARLAVRGVKSMTRQLAADRRSLQTLWGTRGYSGTYLGDELVDYYYHQSTPIPSIQGGATWRPRGHPGLVLLHLISDVTVPEDLVAVGLGLPHGGPDHIAALRL